MSAADYPELYNAIGDRYNLASDNFVQGEEFRLPTGNARLVCGHDASNPNFDTIGKRDGLVEVNVDSSNFHLINHNFIHDYISVGVLVDEDFTYINQKCVYPDLDKEIEPITDNMLLVKVDSNNHYGKYDRWAAYSNNNVMSYLANNMLLGTCMDWTKSTGTAGFSGEDFNPYHSNLQPYITLRMIIKVDKQDWE